MGEKLMSHSSLLNFQATSDTVQLPHEHDEPITFVHLVDAFIKAANEAESISQNG